MKGRIAKAEEIAKMKRRYTSTICNSASEFMKKPRVPEWTDTMAKFKFFVAAVVTGGTIKAVSLH